MGEIDPSVQYIDSKPVLFSNQLFLAAIEVALHSQNWLSSYATGLQQIWELELSRKISMTALWCRILQQKNLEIWGTGVFGLQRRKGLLIKGNDSWASQAGKNWHIYKNLMAALRFS